MPEVKEFKSTCLGCGNITFKPYYDFQGEEMKKKNQTPLEKGAGKVFGGALIAGATMSCLPLGCCLATDAATQKVKDGQPLETKIKNYCGAICSKCNSTAIKIEVVTHIV